MVSSSCGLASTLYHSVVRSEVKVWYRLEWSRDLSVVRYKRLPMVGSGRDPIGVRRRERLIPQQLALDWHDPPPEPSPEDLDRIESDRLRRAYQALDRSARRLRSEVRGLGRRLAFVTLTVGGDRVRSRADIRALFAEFDREYLQGHSFWGGCSLKCVPEPHSSPLESEDGLPVLDERGEPVYPWHLHFVIGLPWRRARVPKDALRWLWSAWTAFLDSKGYRRSLKADGTPALQRIDVVILSSRKAAWYLSNYLTKYFGLDLEREYGQHRWYSRRGVAIRDVLDLESLQLLRALSSSAFEYVSSQEPFWGFLYLPMRSPPKGA